MVFSGRQPGCHAETGCKRFTVQIKNGPDLQVKGSIPDPKDSIGERRDKVAEVPKQGFRRRDSCGVEIEHGKDDIVILAVTGYIDQMAHEESFKLRKNE